MKTRLSQHYVRSDHSSAFVRIQKFVTPVGTSFRNYLAGYGRLITAVMRGEGHFLPKQGAVIDAVATIFRAQYYPVG